MGNPKARYPPNGWTSRPTDGEKVEFRRADGLVVGAERLGECVEQPGLSLTGGWEITCERYVGDQLTRTSIGCVTTKTAALDGLFEVMEAMDELSNTDEHAIRCALGRVTLRNTVMRTSEGRQLG